MCLSSLLLTASHCLAQATESQVKAAYLYNFGKFVTFPADQPASSGGFQICVLGKDPFGPILDSTVHGESIKGQKIIVQRLASVRDASGCSILYIGSSEQANLALILVHAQRLHLLTVSDMAHFAERGGMIGLLIQDDRVRFEVNRSAAEQSRIELSSELLKLAVRIIQDKKAAG